MALNLTVRSKARREVRVTTDIDHGTNDCLMEVIKERGCTRSEFLRALIIAYLDEHEPC
jgi:metal-responsive CopG/Arc/MetJ family transcriptional regulator